MDKIALQKAVEEEIKEAQAKISLYIKNLKTGEVLFQHKEDLSVVSASIIKVPIMVAALEEIQKGVLSKDTLVTVPKSTILEDSEVFEYGERQYTLDELLVWMIINSDNTATNSLIDLLTMDKINQTCRQLNLKVTKLERKMLDFDAVKLGYNNYTSAMDMCLIYKALYDKSILTSDLCDYAVSILLRQRHKQNSMRYITDEVKIAHKTGSLDFLNHDAGIFYLKENDYYFGAFVWDAPDDVYGMKWIGRVSKMVYEYYRHYGH
ncbi:serine hydrolase [Anaerocolumna sedimenticola]|uniref:Serine hydrolase n=1 Tax=Anaerocolumna sedimenticola TaxID=2696063 RepID=A0A6P1TJR6_9FIRM|nr:serine hydrolase [Anaerocolumna sedimenticola]QHQ61344.1 serine hydrolase [Anaerocolumna sedimenticola]